MTIRVALFEARHLKGYVDFHAVPVATSEDYRCMPTGILSLEESVVVTNELKQGAVEGWVQGYRWYRQVKTPHMEPYDDSSEPVS